MDDNGKSVFRVAYYAGASSKGEFQAGELAFSCDVYVSVRASLCFYTLGRLTGLFGSHVYRSEILVGKRVGGK
tara:strand:- start:1666 stop:1884 length:219 start_codon:yes stop_codon:yes gene_type:complete